MWEAPKRVSQVFEEKLGKAMGAYLQKVRVARPLGLLSPKGLWLGLRMPPKTYLRAWAFEEGYLKAMLQHY